MNNTISNTSNVLSVIPKVVSVISLVSILVMVFRIVFRVQDNWLLYHKLLLIYCFCSFCTVIFVCLIGLTTRNSSYCIFQAWIGQMFTNGQIWCLCALATNFLIKVKFEWSDRKVKKLEPLLFLLCFLCPLITSFSGLGLNLYGVTGQWCWISRNFFWYRFIFFYIPLWIILVYVSIVMILIILLVRQNDRLNIVNKNQPHAIEKRSNYFRKVQVQSVLYIFVGVIVWLPGTALRIQEAIVVNQSLFQLQVLQVLAVPSDGFLNFLVFLYPRWSEMRKKFENISYFKFIFLLFFGSSNINLMVKQNSRENIPSLNRNVSSSEIRKQVVLT